MPNLPVYLDNHATTRADPRVVEAMLPYFTETYGNAASVSHRFGWDAAAAVDRAREQVAALIGAEAREVVFTSGATEANNLAIKGALPVLKRKGNHLVTAATEHRAVLDPMRRLAREGWDLTIVPPDEHGLVSAEAVEAALTDRTVLVSVMAANNEVGTINPIRQIGRLCRDRGILFHTDATQAVGKIPLDVGEDAIDLLSLSAHKFYGPKGIGALYVRRGGPRVRLSPLFDGGGHERGFRSGTVAVPLVVGLGEAAALAGREMPGGVGAHPAAARSFARGDRRAGAGDPAQRASVAEAAGQPEPELRRRGRRGADDGDAGRGGQLGVGLHVGGPRAEPCPILDGGRRGDGPRQPPVRAGAVHHGRGGRVRRRRRGRGGRSRLRAGGGWDLTRRL